MASPGSLPSFRTAPERSSRSTVRARLPIPFVPWLSSSRAAGRSGPRPPGPWGESPGAGLSPNAAGPGRKPGGRPFHPRYPLGLGPWPFRRRSYSSSASPRNPGEGPVALAPGTPGPGPVAPGGPAALAFSRGGGSARALPLLAFTLRGPVHPGAPGARRLLPIPDRPFRERSFRVTQTFSPSGPMGKGPWP